MHDVARPSVLRTLVLTSEQAVLHQGTEESGSGRAGSVLAVFPLGPEFEARLLPGGNLVELCLQSPAAPTAVNGSVSQTLLPPPPPVASASTSSSIASASSGASAVTPTKHGSASTNTGSHSVCSLPINGASSTDSVAWKTFRVTLESNVMRDVLVFTIRSLCKVGYGCLRLCVMYFLPVTRLSCSVRAAYLLVFFVTDVVRVLVDDMCACLCVCVCLYKCVMCVCVKYYNETTSWLPVRIEIACRCRKPRAVELGTQTILW